MLHAEVLIANAVADGEARCSLPLILRVRGPVVKTIRAGEAGLGNGQSDGATRRLHEGVGVLVQSAGSGALRIDGGLKLIKLASGEVGETLALILAKLLVGLGVGAERVIFLDVEDLGTELELVTALGEAEVLVVLNGVLRTAAWQAAVARSRRKEAGKLKGVAGVRIDAAGVDVEGGNVAEGGVVGKGCEVVAGEGEFGERGEGRRELMGHAEQIGLAGGGRTDVVLRVGTAVGGAGEVNLVVVNVTEEGLGFGAQVVVEAAGDVVGVLGQTATGIRGCGKEDVVIDRGGWRKTGVERGSATGLGVGGGAVDVEVGMGAVRIEKRLDVGRCYSEQGGVRNGADDVRGGANTRELGRGKEEQLVLKNGAADGSTKLVSSIGALGNAALCVGDGVGCVGGEPVELPNAAVKGVGAGAGSNGDDTTRGAAVLRREVVGNDAIFLHVIEGNRDGYLVGEDGEVFDAVEQDLGSAGSGAVEGEAVCAPVGGGAVLVAAGGGVVAGGDVAGEGDKVVWVTGEGGQLRDLLLADDLRDLGAGRVDQDGGVGADVDGLRGA